MAIEWEIETDDLAIFHVSGKLGKDEYVKAQLEIGKTAKTAGKMKILIMLENFQGWQAEKGWGDTSTEVVDQHITKMAIVGDEKWRDLVVTFTLKGLRPVSIEYFDSVNLDAARQWLDSK